MPWRDKLVLLPHLEGDRPVRAKLGVGLVEEPQPQREAEDPGDKRDRAKRMVREREHRRRDPDEREQEPERGESQKDKLHRPFPTLHHFDLVLPTMQGRWDEDNRKGAQRGRSPSRTRGSWPGRIHDSSPGTRSVRRTAAWAAQRVTSLRLRCRMRRSWRPPFPRSFLPQKLGRHLLKNRICVSAHAESLGEEGVPKERALRYYEARIQGGAGFLMCFGSASVSPESSARVWNGVELFDDRVIPYLAAFSEAIHRHGHTRGGADDPQRAPGPKRRKRLSPAALPLGGPGAEPPGDAARARPGIHSPDRARFRRRGVPTEAGGLRRLRGHGERLPPGRSVLDSAREPPRRRVRRRPVGKDAIRDRGFPGDPRAGRARTSSSGSA